jgi:hypothetical protein
MLTNRKMGRPKSGDADESSLPVSHGTPESKSVKGNKSRDHGVWAGGKILLVLVVGIMLGYAVLPMIVLESHASSFQAGRSITFSSESLRSLEASDVQARLVADQQVLSTQSLPTIASPTVMKTTVLSDYRRKKIVVTGGAGFVGSHLVDKLMMEGHEVTVLDNFFTGQKKNIAHWLHHPNFK